jgi:hypothetical protein
LIEPNNFSPPAFAKILISIFKASANDSATTLAFYALFVLGFQLILSLQMK